MPHRFETNGIAERAVRRVKEGTSAMLVQSGLDEKWCADSMECYFFLRNVQDLLSDGKTPYDKAIWRTIQWAKNSTLVLRQNRLHQFGKKVLPGIFIGFV